MSYSTPQAVRAAAMQDAASHTAGGFAIAKLADGTFDYFPTGHSLPKGSTKLRSFSIYGGVANAIDTPYEKEVFVGFALGERLTDTEKQVLRAPWWEPFWEAPQSAAA